MRIDFVITGLFPGGAEKTLTNLALGLKSRGETVRVFSIQSLPTGGRANLVARLEKGGIEIESGEGDHASAFLRVRRQLVAWLSEGAADICQSFLFHANCLASFSARKAKVRNLVGGIRVADPSRARSVIERLATKRMKSIVCVSDGVQSFVQQDLGFPFEKLCVIPNGVDVKRFSEATPARWSDLTPWPDDSEVILFVGRLHPQKGLELLQSRIDEIAPENSNRRLLLVGEGPLHGELSSWATSVGSNRCVLLPWQPDVAPLMAAAKLFVLPSHREGMANGLLEAMAAALPVVCSRAEGSEPVAGV